VNLLLLDQFSDLGGAQQVLLELLPAFRRRGWKVLVGIPGQGILFERVRESGFETEKIECGPYTSGRKSRADLVRFLGGTAALGRHIREMAGRLRADLIYVNGPRLLPATAWARLSVPVLFHAHSYLGPGPVRVLAGRSLRSTRAWVLGTCRFVAEPWRRYVPEDRLKILYNGVAGPPPDRVVEMLVRPATSPRIGCIGRIAPEKGQREFVAAARIIHQAIPECRFSIFGAPLFVDPAALRYDAEVRAAADGLPVEFAGWVQDVYASLANLDLLLVPSAGHEATTRVILEAFAAGVPVIAFRAGGIPEVVDHQVDGLLADSTEEMARLAIDLLTGDRARIAVMSHAARETWRRRFTLERNHQQVLEWIGNIVQ